MIDRTLFEAEYLGRMKGPGFGSLHDRAVGVFNDLANRYELTAEQKAAGLAYLAEHEMSSAEQIRALCNKLGIR